MGVGRSRSRAAGDGRLGLAFGHEPEQVLVEPGRRGHRMNRARGIVQPGGQPVPQRREGPDRPLATDPVEDLQGPPPVGRRIGTILQHPAIAVGALHQPQLEVLAVGLRQVADAIAKPPIASGRDVAGAEHLVVHQGAAGDLEGPQVLGRPEVRGLSTLAAEEGPGLGIVPLPRQHALRVRPQVPVAAADWSRAATGRTPTGRRPGSIPPRRSASAA